MEEKSKMTKFLPDDLNEYCIRSTILPSRKRIAFAIHGAKASVLQPGEVDFDGQSDELIKKFLGAENNMAFEYDVAAGCFKEVSVSRQTWFRF